jgi:AcrR family transcriptional regulator
MGPSKAEEAVRRSLQRRQEAARAEVDRLVEAGRELFGSGANPRVADIVRAAGVSLEAFYRYFGSKDEFVAAVAEDGADRVTSYVAHRMEGVADPADRLRAAVDALMSQAARPELAAAARNILARVPSDGASFERALADLLAPTLAGLGAADAERDARVAAITLVGALQRFVWSDDPPSEDDATHLAAFVRRAVTS